MAAPGEVTGPTALFTAGALAAFELGERDLDALQQLYEACPGYFVLAMGDPPGSDAARKTLESRPPEDWAWSRKWTIGFRETGTELVAMADLVADLLAPGVWHVGLFMVPERLHGRGFGWRAYAALEAWMREQGAHWLRLGVIEGNARAERFWEASGYVEVRKRASVTMGRQSNTVRVMVKPLAGGAVADYLAVVDRDRPQSE
jgi:RimJ/RimL family protein N-acetyltransferase